jgi:hypothetical protein
MVSALAVTAGTAKMALALLR